MVHRDSTCSTGWLTRSALAISSAVTQLGPLLQRTANQMGDLGTGMELICRVMFDMQQDYYMWLNATGSGRVALVPRLRPADQPRCDAPGRQPQPSAQHMVPQA